MNFKQIKSLMIVSAVFGASVLLGVVTDFIQRDKLALSATYDIKDAASSYFNQDITAQLSQPKTVTKLYHKNQLIGIVSSESSLNAFFDELYTTTYTSTFPDSRLSYSDDVYTVQEATTNVYENIDNKIFDYLVDRHLVAIEVNKISFSNGAIIYAQDLTDFETARQRFISGYVSTDVVQGLSLSSSIPDLMEYGTKLIGFEVLETITYSKGYANIDDVMMDDAEILNFLNFGYDFETEVYTVQEYDTVEGIAWMTQRSPLQLVAINATSLVGVNQVMKPGTQLDVTRINSPLTVRITQQRLVSEPIYPESTLYIEDPTMKEGLRRVEQEGKVGYEDVLYLDVYENDVAVDSVVLNSTVREEAVQEIVYVGTYVDPRVGTGSLRWPMNNSKISCGWGCYAGHQGVDIQSRSNGGYGPVYAADHGVVEYNGYDSSGYGYYIIINHNNGTKTLYAHLEARAYYSVGETVRQGAQIGYVGMTGRTTGPHLHFEVRINNIKQNPCSFIGC